MPDEAKLATLTATAILGIDTIWGGDVMSPSGTGRFIADSWFSDEPLPEAYTHPAAARVRETGGVAARTPDVGAIDAYLAAVDVAAAIDGLAAEARALGGLRGAFLEAEAECLRIMWDLASELRGKGPKVPYARCVEGSTGRAPAPSRPDERRERVAELLGVPGAAPERLLAAVDRWRAERLVPMKALAPIVDGLVARLDEGTRRHVVPHLPASLHAIPRANVAFLPIPDAWFSGSMNYVGRARNADGSPRYEATYEINAGLQLSVPELVDLVAHEVVPGHVTTFALAQALHVQRRLGFEATVLTMNTRHAALSEGIADNALLMAYGVTEVSALPDRDLQLGTLLSLVQGDAKNQASWLTWEEGRPQDEIARTLRTAYLCSEERAGKLSGAWGRHPLNGRMYLPCYRAGTEKVAELRRRHPPGKVIPALYQVLGIVDVVTIDRVL
jgi:hypothetical protein